MDYDSRTGLMLAAVKGHLEVTQILLAWGANPELRDNFGNTAVSEARNFGRSDLLQALERK